MGQNVWLEASYNPVIDERGQVITIVKYALDVTEKVVQEALNRGKLAALDRAMNSRLALPATTPPFIFHGWLVCAMPLTTLVLPGVRHQGVLRHWVLA